MRIEIVRTAERLRSLQDDWVRLAAGNPEASLYNQPKLLALWWEYFGSDPQRPFVLKRGVNLAGNICGTESLYVLVSYEGHQVAAILPLMLLNVQPREEKRFLKCLTFIGDPIFNPTPSIVYLQEKQEAIFNSFAEFLKTSQEWDVIFLNVLRQDYKNLQLFLTVLKTVVGGRILHDSLQEVRFARYWEKEKVIRLLKALFSSGAPSDGVEELMRLVDEIEKTDSAEFSKKCFSDITPRLRESLAIYKQHVAKDQKGGLVQIEHEISRTVPAVYQLVRLPGRIEEFESSLRHGKRWELKQDRAACEAAGIRVDFQKNISDEDFALFVQYHQKRHLHSAALSGQTLNYYKQLLQRLSGEDRLVWTVARDEHGHPVYFLLCFFDVFSSSLDHVISGGEISDLHLGICCITSAIERAIEMKCTCFSFRIGDETYKSRFRPFVIPLECFILSRNKEDDLTRMLPQHWSISENKST